MREGSPAGQWFLALPHLDAGHGLGAVVAADVLRQPGGFAGDHRLARCAACLRLSVVASKPLPMMGGWLANVCPPPPTPSQLSSPP